MAIARYSPDLNQTYPFVADAPITANAVVVGSTADGHVTLPAAGDVTGGIVGVAPNAIASGASGDVVTGGATKCVAGAAITRYQNVVVNSSLGDVKQANASLDAGAQVVGMALESVSNPGDLVSVLLRGFGGGSGSSDSPPFHSVRGVKLGNVASLAAFTVADTTLPTGDGVTYAAGDKILLAGQSTASQNGIYQVGTVGGGTAPLTRAADFPTGAVIPAETFVAVSEGTLYAHSLWRLSSQGSAMIIDTTSLTFTPVLDAGQSVNRQVRCVADANITIATALVTGQTIDGVTLVAGDRVLVANQTVGSQGGVFIAGAVPVIAPDYATGFVKAGMVFDVSEGTKWLGSQWKIFGTQTGAGGYITVGTTDPAFWPKMDFNTVAIGTPWTTAFVRAIHNPCSLNDNTSSTTGTKAILVAGRKTGTVTLTGTGTDSVDVGIFNW